MSRRLDDLAAEFRTDAVWLLARFVEAGIPVMIVDTLRTQEEHEANLAAGVSWTRNSRHLIGRAIDVCPYSQYDLHGPDKLQWDSSDPVWQKLGAIGKKLGFVWGGDWTKKDMGHFQK